MNLYKMSNINRCIFIFRCTRVSASQVDQPDSGVRLCLIMGTHICWPHTGLNMHETWINATESVRQWEWDPSYPMCVSFVGLELGRGGAGPKCTTSSTFFFFFSILLTVFMTTEPMIWIFQRLRVIERKSSQVWWYKKKRKKQLRSYHDFC